MIGDEDFVPFLAIDKRGGPYEEGAFVAGCFFGRADALLQLGYGTEFKVPTPIVHQLDLLAMFHHAEFKSWPDEDGDPRLTNVRIEAPKGKS